MRCTRFQAGRQQNVPLPQRSLNDTQTKQALFLLRQRTFGGKIGVPKLFAWSKTAYSQLSGIVTRRNSEPCDSF